MERTAMPANELEGLIRDRLPDAIRRHLRDVQIDRIDRDDGKPNWIGMPIWETDPSDDDKRKFLATMHRLRGCSIRNKSVGFGRRSVYLANELSLPSGKILHSRQAR